MTLFAAFLVALNALRVNALRSALAMLGIIIGVASVIVLVAVSAGAKQAVEARIKNLGSNLLMITTGGTFLGGRRGGAGSGIPFSEADVQVIRERVAGVARISGVLPGSASVIAGGVNWSTSVLGVHEDFLEVRDWTLRDGRNFSSDEMRAAAKVALIGATVARELFGASDPLGHTVRIRNVPFQIIGVLGEKGQSGLGQDQDDTMLVPISSARRRLFGGGDTVPNRVSAIMVEVDSAEAIPQTQADIEDLLRQRRRVRPGERDSFTVANMAEFIRARTETQNTLSLLLAATSAIALVVGGIGIMNIMLVSVTERTREIGVRMAVGARRRDIRGQFLVEATTLCLIGGLIGLAVGIGGAVTLAAAGAWPMVIDPAMAAVALGSSVMVGVFFGFYPARRAARLNPIDALRYE